MTNVILLTYLLMNSTDLMTMPQAAGKKGIVGRETVSNRNKNTKENLFRLFLATKMEERGIDLDLRTTTVTREKRETTPSMNAQDSLR